MKGKNAKLGTRVEVKRGFHAGRCGNIVATDPRDVSSLVLVEFSDIHREWVFPRNLRRVK